MPLYVLFARYGWIPAFKPLIVPLFFGDAFSIFLLRQFFLTIPEELSDAARMEGASEWQIMTRVIVPLAKPAIAAVALFQFLYSWNDFFAPLLFLGGEPELWTLAIGLNEFRGQHQVEYNLMLAAVGAVHAARDRPVLLRPTRVHGGHHRHRRQGVGSAAMEVAFLGSGWIQDFHARAVAALGGTLAAVANHRRRDGPGVRRPARDRARHDRLALGGDRSLDRRRDRLDPERPARRAVGRGARGRAGTCWSRSRWP